MHGRGTKGEVPDGDPNMPVGKAEVRRHGTDVSIIASSIMVPRTLDAAEQLARLISAEVVDVRPSSRWMRPPSSPPSPRSAVASLPTRLSVAGVSAELAAIIPEDGFSSRKAPVRPVAIPDVHISFAKTEEDFVTPSAHHIVAAAKEICK